MTNITPRRGKLGKAKFLLAPGLGVGLALLITGAVWGCRNSSPTASGGDDSQGAQIKSVLHLEPFVVNLADAEDNRFLRASIDLGLQRSLAGSEGKGDAAIPTSRIRDCILTVLSTWRSDALLAPDGKQKLKDELPACARGADARVASEGDLFHRLPGATLNHGK